ncbi:MAG: disulfide bond formation protein B [Candidatus Zambryskibacteria bacterium]|nr:disulfide bond formation protein B [Candidatus Zambryskibacteria bacterium]
MISFIQTNASPIVGFLTLVSNIIFVVVLIVIGVHSGSRAKLYSFVHKYILELLFWGIMSAVIGSLIYSEIISFPPCDLCWYQRMFMYPQAIIVLMAMFRKDKTIIDYLVPLSILGAVIALYQSFIQWGFSFGSILKFMLKNIHTSPYHLCLLQFLSI